MSDADPLAGAIHLGQILERMPWVRTILRRIVRESRDEYSREQAEQALRLLEMNDGS